MKTALVTLMVYMNEGQWVIKQDKRLDGGAGQAYARLAAVIEAILEAEGVNFHHGRGSPEWTVTYMDKAKADAMGAPKIMRRVAQRLAAAAPDGVEVTFTEPVSGSAIDVHEAHDPSPEGPVMPAASEAATETPPAPEAPPAREDAGVVALRSALATTDGMLKTARDHAASMARKADEAAKSVLDLEAERGEIAAALARLEAA